MNSSQVRDEILHQIKIVASEQDKQLGRLHDSLPLIDSGLDSLCFAILVARLETNLAVDPFSSDEYDRFPVTLGDFINLYENASK